MALKENSERTKITICVHKDTVRKLKELADKNNRLVGRQLDEIMKNIDKTT